MDNGGGNKKNKNLSHFTTTSERKKLEKLAYQVTDFVSLRITKLFPLAQSISPVACRQHFIISACNS